MRRVTGKKGLGYNQTVHIYHITRSKNPDKAECSGKNQTSEQNTYPWAKPLTIIIISY